MLNLFKFKRKRRARAGEKRGAPPPDHRGFKTVLNVIPKQSYLETPLIINPVSSTVWSYKMVHFYCRACRNRG